MKLLNFFALSLICSPLIFLNSCKHEAELAPGTAVVCFDNQIAPVLQSSCAMSGCHDGNNGELPALYTYEDVSRLVTAGKPTQSKLYKAITANPNSESFMPPKDKGSLSNTQIDLIAVWILQGANHTNCDIPCDTNSYTFSGAILPLVQTYCKGCHSGNTPSGDILLTDYATVKSAVESGRFVGAVEHQAGFSAMPKGGNKLSDCNIVQINKWIANGMPND
jgi:hypothetical protein